MDEKNYDRTLDIKETRIFAYLTLGLLTFIIYGEAVLFVWAGLQLI